MGQSSQRSQIGQIFLTSLPIGLAIGVFGTIYGAMSVPYMGPGLTLLSSVFIWSGVVQFALAGLLHTKASAGALLVTAVVLNLRNPLFGAILRPYLNGSPVRRAFLSWFLIDETVGLAVTAKDSTGTTLLVSGLTCYLGWVLGTLIGVAGGTLTSLRTVAESVFPVLFVGLAAISATKRDLVLRALGAAALSIGLALVWPSARGLAPVLAAFAVAIPGRNEK